MAIPRFNLPAPIASIISVLLIFNSCTSVQTSTSFQDDFFVTWAPEKVKFLNGGQQLELALDQSSGSGFASKRNYLFGKIDMQIKLVPGDSSGTVTAYYLSSQTTNHDELDFEFLGNLSGEPYILQTNVYASGIGNREQRIYLWFDPSADFHTYSLSWGKEYIIFLVDGTPIRIYPNFESLGVPYPNTQPMAVFSSLWNGDSWATRGGLVKINWNNAPFIARYQNFMADACVVIGSPLACTSYAGANQGPWTGLGLDVVNKLKWVRKNFMVYDYCSDKPRYPVSPPECTVQL